MDPVAVLIVGFVLLVLLGAPVGLSMLVLPIGYTAVTHVVPLSTVPYLMYEALARSPLIAIPFFLLTGELMNSGRITERLLLFSRELVGRVRGGLAQVNILVSMLFAGMNGSAVADTATVGSIMIPAMKKSGYSAAFSAAVTAISSTIGGIIPPSIAMVLLASGIGISVGGLFTAGLIPGVLVGLTLMTWTYFVSVRRGYERYEEPFHWGTLLSAARGCTIAFLIPVVLVGGIVLGVFTATEAGAITAVLALIVGTLVYRGLSLRQLGRSLTVSVKLTASVFIIIAAAGPFSWLLTRIGALRGLESWLLGFQDSPVVFALALIGFTFVAGLIMDAVANIIVLGPTLVGAAVTAGFPEFQAAVVVSVGFLLGTVTPPVGICFFTAGYLSGERLERVALALLPFIVLEILILLLLMAVPGLTMWLPRVLGYV